MLADQKNAISSAVQCGGGFWKENPWRGFPKGAGKRSLARWVLGARFDAAFPAGRESRCGVGNRCPLAHRLWVGSAWVLPAPAPGGAPESVKLCVRLNLAASFLETYPCWHGQNVQL